MPAPSFDEDNIIDSRDDSRSWLDRLWRSAMHPATIGGMIAISGLILAIGPFSVGSEHTLDWWIETRHHPSLRSAAWALAGAGAILLLGRLWSRHRSERDLLSGPFELVPDGPWRALQRRIGLSCLVLGAGCAIGGWIGATGEMSTGRLVLTPGQTAESYQTHHRRGSMKVMLPRRITLTELSLGDPLKATIELKQAGADEGTTAQLVPGRSIRADDLRLTPVGLSPAEGTKRAIVSSRRPRTISVTAHPGESFRVRPEGRSYELVDIIDNYLKSLGPAARIQSEKFGEFLVFQRMPESERAPDFRHDLMLDGLERVPAFVVRVSRPAPIWPSGLGGGLMVVGVALALTSSVRRDDREETS